MTGRIERHNPKGITQHRKDFYSMCVRVTGPGTTLYLAGQVARDESGKSVGQGDIAAQTAQVFENMRTVLRAEGADLENLVRICFYLIDMRDMPVVDRVRRRYLKTDLPAATLVEVSKFSHPDYLIEIDGVAVIP